MSSPSEPGSFILRASRRVLDKLASGKELIPGLGRPGAKFEDRWPGYLSPRVLDYGTACMGLEGSSRFPWLYLYLAHGR